jgi:hypothetical protein
LIFCLYVQVPKNRVGVCVNKKKIKKPPAESRRFFAHYIYSLTLIFCVLSIESG